MSESSSTPKTTAEKAKRLETFLAHFQGGGLAQYNEEKNSYYPIDPKAKEDYKIWYHRKIVDHLKGLVHLGMYLLRDDNKIRFAALDFDCHKDGIEFTDVLDEARNVIKFLQENGITPLMEVSKSKQGIHVFIFFSDWVDPKPVRRVLAWTLEECTAKYCKEIFPKQDRLTGKGKGNLISLPLSGKFVKNDATKFYDIESFTPMKDQIETLEQSAKHDISVFEKIINENNLKDKAKISKDFSFHRHEEPGNTPVYPPCIQAMEVIPKSGYGHDALFCLAVFFVNNTNFADEKILSEIKEKYRSGYDEEQEGHVKRMIAQVRENSVKSKEDASVSPYSIGCISDTSKLNGIIEAHFQTEGVSWCPYGDEEIKRSQCPFFDFDVLKTYIINEAFQKLDRAVPPTGGDFDEFYRQLIKLPAMAQQHYINRIKEDWKVNIGQIREYLNQIRQRELYRRLKLDQMEPCNHLIKRWASAHYEFIHRVGKHLFSKKLQREITLGEFRETCPDNIRELLYERGAECNPPRVTSPQTPYQVMKYFSATAPNVYHELSGELPDKKELADDNRGLTKDDKKRYLGVIVTLFHTQFTRNTFDSKTERYISIRDSLFNLANTAASSEKWKRIFDFDFFYCRRGGNLFIAIRPTVFLQFREFQGFYNEHAEPQVLSTRMVKYDLGTANHMRIEGERKKFRAIMLNMPAINTYLMEEEMEKDAKEPALEDNTEVIEEKE